MRRRFPTLILCLTWFALAGCERDDEIRVYRAPKDSPPPRADVAMQPPSPSAAQAGEIQWVVPAGWTEAQPPQFSVAAFSVSKEYPNALVTVSPLGPEAGDPVANINRWEGQLGLPPTAAAELSKLTRTIPTAAGDATIVDLSGPRGRMLAAILPRPDRVWFFKLMGETALIESQKDNFDAFVRSVIFGEAPAQPITASTTADESFDGATWSAPKDWVLGPAQQMRVATYRTSADEGAPEVIISKFTAGGFGTPLDNINRWRRMVGLPPVEKESDQPSDPLKVGGNDGQIYDMTGAEKRLRIGLVQVGEQVWFFRLVGATDAVAKEIETFDSFLQSVQFK